MGDDPELRAARAEAAAMLVTYRASGLIGGGAGDRPAVYILAGCACAEQGAHRRYHLHAYTPARLAAWRARHPAGRIVADYPL